MKVSMTLYGDRAQQLKRILSDVTELPMNAHFRVRDVEGRTVIEACFTADDPHPKTKSLEQRAKEALELEAECAQLRAELKAMME